jgi:hypothetical protein
MIDDTIKQIEEKLIAAGLSEEKRRELSSLLGSLRSELTILAAKDEDKAQSVAGFATLTSHEATRRETDPALLDTSLRGLQASVENMETEQPLLVQTVNAICRFLSNSGI